MNFYLAGPYEFRNALAVFADKMKEKGHRCAARWIRSDGEEDCLEAWEDYAERDLEDIANEETDTFILITLHEPLPRNSRLVELGLALGYNKHIVIIGPTETIFCTLADEQYASLEEYYETVPNINGPIVEN